MCLHILSYSAYFYVFCNYRIRLFGLYQSKANVVRRNHILYIYIGSAYIHCRPSTDKRHFRVTTSNRHPAEGDKSIAGRSRVVRKLRKQHRRCHCYMHISSRRFVKIVVFPATPNALWVDRISTTLAEPLVVQSCTSQQPQYDSYALRMSVGYLFFPRERLREM